LAYQRLGLIQYSIHMEELLKIELKYLMNQINLLNYMIYLFLMKLIILKIISLDLKIYIKIACLII